MRKIMMAAALAATMTAAPAVAQNTGAGLVAVNISDVLDVNNNNVDVRVRDVLSQLNTQVIAQVPIGLAANVCGTTVAVLSQAGSAAECEAKTDINQGQAQALAQANKRKQ